VADSDDCQSLQCPPDCQDAKEGERLRRKLDKRDYHSVLNSMRSSESALRIPLCRLLPLPRVRPVQEVDVRRLEILFEDSDGYDDADRALYVSIYNDKESSTDLTDDIRSSWSTHWQEANDLFESHLDSSDIFSQFRGKMFYVWDGNHRFSAWWRKINSDHSDDARWHFAVNCIVLDPRGRIGPLLNAMNDVNWYAAGLPLLSC
jgi:hypothetical protein